MNLKFPSYKSPTIKAQNERLCTLIWAGTTDDQLGHKYLSKEDLLKLEPALENSSLWSHFDSNKDAHFIIGFYLVPDEPQIKRRIHIAPEKPQSWEEVQTLINKNAHGYFEVSIERILQHLK